MSSRKSFATYDGVTANGKRKVECWSEKNGKQPRDVALNTHSKFWFNCDKCSHDFESILRDVNKQGQWCPFCANQKLCSTYDCTHCFNKSFASYDGLTENGKRKVECWSEKNGKKQPRDVALNSHSKFWFHCDKCAHDFESRVSDVNIGRWCSYCANQKLCSIYDCTHCFKNSFASYDGLTANGKRKVECWSEKNGKKQPRDVALNSCSKFWFHCDKCAHDFESRLGDVNNGRWCPYCANKKLCSTYDCTHCFKNSFASYDGLTANGKRKVECWSEKNGNKQPRDVALNSCSKFWFHCDKCAHDFDSTLNHVNNESWCPHCNTSHGESEVRSCLARRGYPDESQTTFKECRDTLPLPFDNAILTDKLLLKILIEFDGIQHFSNHFFGGHKEYRMRVRHDILKNKYCLENGFVLLRIAYTEFNMIDSLIEVAIRRSQQNKPGIIFSNPRLYKTFWLSKGEIA